ncbi:DinB family protein [Celerinatantimonas sp. YJH-8]|uniref:DinB family protein n=1 Tax=Celerinatantimonas sp. YJH-8 TaxID=3228714 RepID=UPI0038C722BA
MKQQFILMSDYNQWMNNSFFSHLAKMNDNDIYGDKKAFWGSAFNTVSHIFTCDLLWLNRFKEVESDFNLSEALLHFPNPKSNQEHCFSTLAELHQHRIALDAVIIAWVKTITASELTKPLIYQNTAGKKFSEPFASVLLHFFNHQTHHRGQVSTLISQSGDNSYCSDLIVRMRELT